MPTSLVSTGVQFPDSTTQTTALPAPGSAGNVLTSTGSAWSSSAPGGTGLYQGPTVYDRQVTFAGDLWATAANGSVRIQAIQLTATTELVLFYGNGGSGIYAVVWDNSTRTFGSSVLVRSVDMGNVASVDNVAAIQVTTNTVLVCSCPTSSLTLATVVLTVSGTTITVGTEVTASTTVFPAFLNSSGGSNASFRVGFNRLIQTGSSYVLIYSDVNGNTKIAARAITVSGTTPTIGSEVTVRNIANPGAIAAVNMTAGVVAISYAEQNALYFGVLSVSGTTVTVGTQTQLTSTGLTVGAGPIGLGMLSTGRAIIAYRLSTGGRVTIMNTSGTVSTLSASQNFSGTFSSNSAQIIGDKFILVSASTAFLFRDNAGTLVEDNKIDLVMSGTQQITHFDGTNIYVGAGTSGSGNPMYVISAPSTTLSVNALYPTPISSATVSGVYRFGFPGYNVNYSGPDYGGFAAIAGNYWTSGGKLLAASFSNEDLYLAGLNISSAANGSIVPYENPGLACTGGGLSATRSALSNAAGFCIAYPLGQASHVSRRRLQVRRIELT